MSLCTESTSAGFKVYEIKKNKEIQSFYIHLHLLNFTNISSVGIYYSVLFFTENDKTRHVLKSRKTRNNQINE